MSDVVATVKSDFSWIQRHERILVIAMVLLAGCWLGAAMIDKSKTEADLRATYATEQLKTQQAVAAKQAGDSQQAIALYQQTISVLTQQNSQLATAISKRNDTLVKQQVADKSLPLPGLADRWRTLTNVATTDITASPSGITVTDTGARETVAQLEQVPVLTANLADMTTVADNRQKELDKATDAIGKLNTQVSGLNTEIVKQDEACKAEVKAVKADARKSKLKWFKFGFVTGFVSGLFAGHVAHL